MGHWNFLNVSKDTLWDLSGNGNHGRVWNTKANAAGRLFGVYQDSVEIKDNPSFQLTRSITIEAFCEIQGFPSSVNNNNYNHAALLYRGDGRSGKDPYFLSVEPDQRSYDQQWLKHIRFHVESDNATDDVGVLAALNVPLHIAAVLDDNTGMMSLWINGVKKTEKKTNVRSFGALDPAQGPGVALGSHPGNVKYRFPFIGVIKEIRLLNYPMPESEIKRRAAEGPTGILQWRTGGERAYAPRVRSWHGTGRVDDGLPVGRNPIYTISGRTSVSGPEERRSGVFLARPVK
jgi:Concanavalin A-like lectin/glucanases superfamily